ncbi:hypothetical protein OKA05_10785 [Luteolibacter arcticus]|uniref:Uncharacterized protein n=1 Tax=Luteolibacter arcticus TaxID=1581411 RepID=A0ABT3GHE1_9BACT|nr:hypothetical protein [Luteolibacter arcticus]MCW1923039.1 hypothetical protein [Luteolibacter arcticus]
MKFSTYREFSQWLVDNGHHQCLVEIATDSISFLPDEAHLKTSMSVFLCQVMEYLHSGMKNVASAPFGSVGNLEAFFKVWMFLDCPGLNDQVVVKKGREWGFL